MLPLLAHLAPTPPASFVTTRKTAGRGYGDVVSLCLLCAYIHLLILIDLSPTQVRFYSRRRRHRFGRVHAMLRDGAPSRVKISKQYQYGFYIFKHKSQNGR